MRKLMSIFVAAGLVMALSAPVSAVTDRIPIGGTETLVEVLDPGRAWMSDGVEHVRDWTAVFAVTGDQYSAGTSTVVVNWNLATSTGDGTMWGINRVRLDAYDGGWTQRWTATWSGGTWAGRGVGHGFGEIAGWQTRIDVWATGLGTDAFVGYAFAPGH